MKIVCFINGSLRGKKASSLEFLNDVNQKLSDAEYSKTFITVKARVEGGYPEDTLKSIAGTDVIILVFPLFSYGLPGALMRLIEDYYQYIKSGNEYNRNAKVYMIVNCGFPRPHITGEAVRVVKNFCRRLSLNWRFAVCIGGGPVVVMTRRVPFLDLKLKKAYAEIASDIREDDKGERANYLIKPVIPEPICIRIKNYYEKKGKMIERNKKPQKN